MKGFTKEEQKSVLGITFAIAVRMLGLFLLLPVLSPYAKGLPGSTPLLVGLAFGTYGFAQAFLQIPFGYLSDKYGRKPIITIGMLTYVLGSFWAGFAHTAIELVLARFVQGFGAVSSALSSLAADLTREEVRTQAFAHIGAAIGMVFAFSIVVAPIMAHYIGVPAMFYITGILSFIAMVYILVFIKEPKVHAKDREINPSLKNILTLMKDKNQIMLNTSVTVAHYFLVSVFTVVPIYFIKHGFPKSHHWIVYLPTVFLALVIMVPATIVAERKAKMKEVFLTAIFSLIVGFTLFFIFRGVLAGVLLIMFFFIGFFLLEPIMPSLLTKLTHKDLRGLSMGFYNMNQFVGAFLGGVFGGIFLTSPKTMSIVDVAIGAIWLILTYKWLSSIKIPRSSKELEEEFIEPPGLY
ncbi:MULTISPECIES: MFS transporter [unclassified Hydrogenobaculum]|jgi:Arabinose efflux permease|uniref:MFS transporter n=1 Tax=unclassified Hydrogenobaculum TaxID=2622382 RepID=UPI0001C515E3|nr:MULTISPECIES: MFS transporter [unclassified Hydrogenobaculum]AEF19000.1 major facilitator superfamily MFS_1 [Hydrogenobaculum sp. 3684]AEG46287.1 major facilitator superfamily MFS_1 [Hydrogenobaculum sp. SHO]AGG14932.1 major facilitator superfamily MFS_1 [Hydrogenobaculum sp. HO]AGH93228.1 arabinose efflux permease family protein [Hydrogenobaculum sp. SN]